MKNILYTIILCLLSTNLLADATQGEMFGFKLGDIYTIKKSDIVSEGIISRSKIVQIKDGIKPKNYGNIVLHLTRVSNTIHRIASHTCFKNNTERQNFFFQQATILKALYPPESNIAFSVKLVGHRESDSGNDYWIIIWELTSGGNPLGVPGNPCVQIALQTHHSNKLHKQLEIKKEEEYVIFLRGSADTTEGL